MPCDVDNFDTPEIVNFPKRFDCEDDRANPGPLAMYCYNVWAYTIERKHGYVARMSAPGYMDRTDWSAHETEEAARKHLEEMYGDDE